MWTSLRTIRVLSVLLLVAAGTAGFFGWQNARANHRLANTQALQVSHASGYLDQARGLLSRGSGTSDPIVLSQAADHLIAAFYTLEEMVALDGSRGKHWRRMAGGIASAGHDLTKIANRLHSANEGTQAQDDQRQLAKSGELLRAVRSALPSEVTYGKDPKMIFNDASIEEAAAIAANWSASQ